MIGLTGVHQRDMPAKSVLTFETASVLIQQLSLELTQIIVKKKFLLNTTVVME